jgi:hypothetical protein
MRRSLSTANPKLGSDATVIRRLRTNFQQAVADAGPGLNSRTNVAPSAPNLGTPTMHGGSILRSHAARPPNRLELGGSNDLKILWPQPDDPHPRRR